MRIAFWRKPALSEERREALEQWARLRFELLQDDPMIAIVGAVGRLTEEGMEHDAAIETVLRILRQEVDPGMGDAAEVVRTLALQPKIGASLRAAAKNYKKMPDYWWRLTERKKRDA